MSASALKPRPLWSALKKAFDGADKVHVFDYESSFDDLWLKGLSGSPSRIGDSVIDWASDKALVVIVGTNAPQRTGGSVKSVTFSQYLTSLAWVAAWRLKYPTSKVHVSVVGDGRVLTGLSAKSLQKLFSSFDAQKRAVIPGVSCFSTPSLYPLLESLRNGASQFDDTASHILKNTVWASLAANPDDHHSISNILGAFILRGHLEGIARKKPDNAGQATTPTPIQSEVQEDGAPSPYETHMLALLRALGIQAEEKATDAESLPWPGHEDNQTPPPCMLIDDMHQTWRPFLKMAFGTNPYIGLSPGQPNLGILLATLSKSAEIGKTTNALRQAVPVLENHTLFLDLRLFDDATEEKSFLGKLHAVARTLNITGSPWPGFSVDELTKMGESISLGMRGKNEGYLLALTLLPRLLAIYFPTLPIVVFSSTTQPVIFKALSPYGNIITDFQKPSFFSGAMVGDVTETTRRTFVRAVQKATGIQKARTALSHIRLKKTTSHQATGTSQVATIFIDESGDLETSTLFGLGAFVVIGDDYTTSENFSSVLEQTDLVWGFSERNFSSPTDGTGWAKKVIDQIPGTFLTKNAEYSADKIINRRHQADFNSKVDVALEQIRNCARQVNVTKCAAAAFIYDISHLPKPLPASLDFSSVADLDVLYRSGLRDLLRFLLSEWPPIAEPLKKGTLKVRVEVATRELRAAVLSNPPYRDELIRKYGARLRHIRNNDFGLFTMTGPEVFPLVAGIFADLKLPLSSICGARAVILHDFDSVRSSPDRMKVEEALPLQAHYIADWVAKFACKQRQHIPRAMLDLFQIGFLQEISKAFHSLWLNIDKGSRDGRRVDAIVNISSAALSPEDALHSGESAELYLREIANKWRRGLNGVELKSLFERMT